MSLPQRDLWNSGASLRGTRTSLVSRRPTSHSLCPPAPQSPALVQVWPPEAPGNGVHSDLVRSATSPALAPRCHAGVHPIGVSSDSRDEALPQTLTAAGGAQWDSQGCHARRDWPRGTAVLPSPHRRCTQTGKQLSGQPHGRAGRRSPCDTASKTPRFTRRDSQPGTGRPCQRQDTTRGAHSSDGRSLITTVACGSWSRATFLPTNTCGDKNNIEPGATEK